MNFSLGVLAGLLLFRPLVTLYKRAAFATGEALFLHRAVRDNIRRDPHDKPSLLAYAYGVALVWLGSLWGYPDRSEQLNCRNGDRYVREGWAAARRVTP